MTGVQTCALPISLGVSKRIPFRLLDLPSPTNNILGGEGFLLASAEGFVIGGELNPIWFLLARFKKCTGLSFLKNEEF